jgi:hypothetical protein
MDLVDHSVDPLICSVRARADANYCEGSKQPRQSDLQIPINVVERSTTAVNYRHRSGSTWLDFRGTALLPSAHGEAEVESRKGYIEIKTQIWDLQPASRFGPEFLTYVLWAITPEGRAMSLGEVLLDGNFSGDMIGTTASGPTSSLR